MRCLLVPALGGVLGFFAAPPAPANELPSQTRAVVLLTDNADGWAAVRTSLEQDHYDVRVVATGGLDAANALTRTQDAIAALGKPVVLAGDAGTLAVVDEAGRDARVKALVYISAKSASSQSASAVPAATNDEAVRQPA